MNPITGSRQGARTTRYDDLAGRVVIVTGANGGMGSAVCLALDACDARVVASDVQPEAGEALVAASKNLSYHAADVSVPDDVSALVSAAVAQHGSLDCAVNVAAVEFEIKRLADCTVEEFDRIIDVNLRGTFLCMKYQIAAMIEAGTPGSIVNFASTTSFQPGTLQPAYTASKHGVLGLTRQAALDYAADGIRVNAVAPGNIDTPMFRNAVERRGVDLDRITKSMPFGRFGDTTEIAAATLFLCSNASSFTSGHTLTVEGAMLIS